MINVFQPALGAEELLAVKQVFDSNWVGKGAKTNQFENLFANYIGVEKKYVQSVNSCTEGLFQAIALLDIEPGDEVILPTISFVGAANAIVSCGAKPVFCDVDKRTLNPTVHQIEEKITAYTKAVIILHYGGVPCQIEPICQLLKQHNIWLIEDSACSVATRYKGQACGTFGDIGVWSFDAMKVLVTGDGGMIYCKDAQMAERAEKHLYLGQQARSGFENSAHDRWWEFEISNPGRRSIMNDITSAIGIEQLKKLPGFIVRRQEIYQYYNQALADLDWLQLPPENTLHTESSYYFYWVQTTPFLRDQLACYLRDQDIYTTFRYYPLHWVDFYGATTSLLNAEEAANTTLCLPIHQSLSNDDLAQIIASIRKFGQGI